MAASRVVGWDFSSTGILTFLAGNFPDNTLSLWENQWGKVMGPSGRVPEG